MQSKHGNAWAKITSQLPGRTDNAVKNRFWSAMRSRMRRNGGESKRHYPKEQREEHERNTYESSDDDESEVDDRSDGSFSYDADCESCLSDDMKFEDDVVVDSQPKVVTPTLRPIVKSFFDLSALPPVKIPESQWSTSSHDPYSLLYYCCGTAGVVRVGEEGVGNVSPCSSSESWSSASEESSSEDEEDAFSDEEDAFSDDDMSSLDEYCAALMEGIEEDPFEGGANFHFTPEGVFTL